MPLPKRFRPPSRGAASSCAYSHAGEIVDATVAQPGGAVAAAMQFLSDDAVAEAHVRHVSYTCFDFKIVRVS